MNRFTFITMNLLNELVFKGNIQKVFQNILKLPIRRYYNIRR